MLVIEGTKVLVCHRRLFADDQARFFIGVVEAYEHGVARVNGFTWTRDPAQGFQRKADRRTKLISVASGTSIVYVLEGGVCVEDVRIEQPGGHQVVATDGGKFRMDLAERL